MLTGNKHSRIQSSLIRNGLQWALQNCCNSKTGGSGPKPLEELGYIKEYISILDRSFTFSLPSSSKLPLPYLSPTFSLQMSFFSHANRSSALLPLIFLKPKLTTSYPCLKPFNDSLSVRFSFPGIRVLHNLTTIHTPVNVALIYIQPLLHKHTGLLTGPWMPQALSLLSSHSVPTVWHFLLNFFNWKTHTNFQDLVEMSPLLWSHTK